MALRLRAIQTHDVEVVDAPVAENAKPKKKATVADITKAFITLRDEKARLTKVHNNKVAEIDAAMERINGLLLQHMDKNKLQNMGTEYGIAYIAPQVSVTVADWDQFLPYVVEHGQWQLLERRVGKEATKEFKDANKFLPPGVNYAETRRVNIRRK